MNIELKNRVVNTISSRRDFWQWSVYVEGNFLGYVTGNTIISARASARRLAAEYADERASEEAE